MAQLYRTPRNDPCRNRLRCCGARVGFIRPPSIAPAIRLSASGPWTPTVHAPLRHLEEVGFDGAPRLVGFGLDADGREMLTFIHCDVAPWNIVARAGRA